MGERARKAEQAFLARGKSKVVDSGIPAIGGHRVATPATGKAQATKKVDKKQQPVTPNPKTPKPFRTQAGALSARSPSCTIGKTSPQAGQFITTPHAKRSAVDTPGLVDTGNATIEDGMRYGSHMEADLSIPSTGKCAGRTPYKPLPGDNVRQSLNLDEPRPEAEADDVIAMEALQLGVESLLDVQPSYLAEACNAITVPDMTSFRGELEGLVDRTGQSILRMPSADVQAGAIAVLCSIALVEGRTSELLEDDLVENPLPPEAWVQVQERMRSIGCYKSLLKNFEPTCDPTVVEMVVRASSAISSLLTDLEEEACPLARNLHNWLHVAIQETYANACGAETGIDVSDVTTLVPRLGACSNEEFATSRDVHAEDILTMPAVQDVSNGPVTPIRPESDAETSLVCEKDVEATVNINCLKDRVLMAAEGDDDDDDEVHCDSVERRTQVPVAIQDPSSRSPCAFDEEKTSPFILCALTRDVLSPPMGWTTAATTSQDQKESVVEDMQRGCSNTPPESGRGRSLTPRSPPHSHSGAYQVDDDHYQGYEWSDRNTPEDTPDGREELLDSHPTAVPQEPPAWTGALVSTPRGSHQSETAEDSHDSFLKEHHLEHIHHCGTSSGDSLEKARIHTSSPSLSDSTPLEQLDHSKTTAAESIEEDICNNPSLTMPDLANHQSQVADHQLLTEICQSGNGNHQASDLLMPFPEDICTTSREEEICQSGNGNHHLDLIMPLPEDICTTSRKEEIWRSEDGSYQDSGVHASLYEDSCTASRQEELWQQDDGIHPAPNLSMSLQEELCASSCEEEPNVVPSIDYSTPLDLDADKFGTLQLAPRDDFLPSVWKDNQVDKDFEFRRSDDPIPHGRQEGTTSDLSFLNLTTSDRTTGVQAQERTRNEDDGISEPQVQGRPANEDEKQRASSRHLPGTRGVDRKGIKATEPQVDEEACLDYSKPLDDVVTEPAQHQYPPEDSIPPTWKQDILQEQNAQTVSETIDGYGRDTCIETPFCKEAQLETEAMTTTAQMQEDVETMRAGVSDDLPSQGGLDCLQPTYDNAAYVETTVDLAEMLVGLSSKWPPQGVATQQHNDPAVSVPTFSDFGKNDPAKNLQLENASQDTPRRRGTGGKMLIKGGVGHIPPFSDVGAAGETTVELAKMLDKMPSQWPHTGAIEKQIYEADNCVPTFSNLGARGESTVEFAQLLEGLPKQAPSQGRGEDEIRGKESLPEKTEDLSELLRAASTRGLSSGNTAKQRPLGKMAARVSKPFIQATRSPSASSGVGPHFTDEFMESLEQYVENSRREADGDDHTQPPEFEHRDAKAHPGGLAANALHKTPSVRQTAEPYLAAASQSADRGREVAMEWLQACRERFSQCARDVSPVARNIIAFGSRWHAYWIVTRITLGVIVLLLFLLLAVELNYRLGPEPEEFF